MNPKLEIVLSILLILFALFACTPSTTSFTQTPTHALVEAQPTNTLVPTSTIAFTPTKSPPPTVTYTPTYIVSPNSLFLSDIKPYSGPKNVFGGLALDRVFWQPKIWIDGVYYPKGLGMHAPESGIGVVSYKVPDGYTGFAALAGLARQDENPGCTSSGDVKFRVFVNNNIQLESGLIRFGPPLHVEVAVIGGDILRLEVDRGDDNYECDHATWAYARFEP
ncbi:MAG: NPCBM/NEW2 domain-containing protein [Anaerolineales bacterium]